MTSIETLIEQCTLLQWKNRQWNRMGYVYVTDGTLVYPVQTVKSVESDCHLEITVQDYDLHALTQYQGLCR